MATFHRVNEDCVTGAIRRMDVDVGLNNRQFCARRRTGGSGKPGCHGQRDEGAP
jgi:hypothetical protein